MRADMGSSPTDSEPSTSISKRRWWALSFLTGANLLAFASVTIMNVALPQTQTQLSMTDGSAHAVLTVYSLTFGTLILVGGRIADTLGLRRCLTGGLIAFALSSLLGGFAAVPAVLLVARALQGGAAAFIAATAIPLMSVIFSSGRNRSIAFGTLGIVMGIGTAGSFVLGGAMADMLSWRWSLLINVPLALLTAAGIHMTVPKHRSSSNTGLDLRGAVLASLSLGLLVFGLDRASELGWQHSGAHASLAGGILGIGLFVVSLRRAKQPLIPLHLLSSRARVAGYLAAFFAGIAMFAGMFVLTSFMQSAWHVSSLLMGLAFLPFAAGATIVTVVLPRIRSYIAPPQVLAAGLMLAAGGLASLGFLNSESGYSGGILTAMLLLGAGGTVVMVTAGDVATAEAADDSGVAGALVNSSQQVGAALGTAAVGAVIQSAIQGAETGESEPIAATVAGYAQGGLIGAAIVTAAAIAMFAIRAPAVSEAS
ncbi:MFS transporter [Brevibacterium sp. S22]|uniref:MFS transporter n=2 Tax=Brevibacterium TaxID=1696 RepID=UPI0010931446|nr:MFS transporter [Brevibacterium sp. S22]TGD32696.1 MFS transporter [Brevibacterium sp. S22]